MKLVPVIFVLAVLASLGVTGAKLCCDQDCMKPISYGRTKDRYITRETGHLSFPNAAIVTVLAKQATVDVSGREMWLVEIQSRKGLIPAEFVNELHTLCEPKHSLEGSINSGSTADNSMSKHHTESEQKEPTENHNPSSFHSKNPLIQPSSQSENTLVSHFHPADTLKKHNSKPKELCLGNEQNREYTVYRSSENLSEDEQQIQEVHVHQQLTPSLELLQNVHTSDLSTTASNSVPVSDTVSPTHDQLVQSIPIQNPRDVGVPDDVMKLHRQVIHQEDHLPNSLHENNSPGKLQGNKLEESTFDVMLDDDNALGHISDDTSDKEVNSGDENRVLWHDEKGTITSMNQQSDSTVSKYPTPSEVYAEHVLSSDHMNVEDRYPSVMEISVGNEHTQLHYRNKAVDNIPSLVHSQSSYTNPLVHTSHIPTAKQNEAYSQLPTSQDSTKFDSQLSSTQDLTNPIQLQVTGIGQDEQLLGEGTARLITDYDGLDIDLPGNEYMPDATSAENDGKVDKMEKSEDVDPQPTDMLPDTETNLLVKESSVDEPFEGNHSEESIENHTYGVGKQDSKELEQAGNHVQSELKNPSPTEHQYEHHHNYLDVHSLRQRYQQERVSESGKSSSSTEVSEETVADMSGVHSTRHLLADQTDTQHHLPEIVKHMPTEHVLSDGMKQPPLPETTHQPMPVVSDSELYHKKGVAVSPDDESHQEKTLASVLSTRGESTVLPSQHLEPPTSAVRSVELITRFLPPSLASWVLTQGPEFLGLVTSILAVVLPLCCSCCHLWRDTKRKAITISKQAGHTSTMQELVKEVIAAKSVHIIIQELMNLLRGDRFSLWEDFFVNPFGSDVISPNRLSSRSILEEQIKKLKSEKSTVHTELLLLEERCSSLQHEVEQVQESYHSVTEAKADLEAHCERVTSDLNSVQQELIQCKKQVDQLCSELTCEQMQLSAQTADKEVAMQQVSLLRGQIKEYELNVQELEAAKEQLEEDAFVKQNSLQQLQKLHTQVIATKSILELMKLLHRNKFSPWEDFFVNPFGSVLTNYVSQELADSISETAQLKSKLNCLQEDVLCLQDAKTENEQEMQTLRDCLGQVITGTVTSGSGQDEEVDGTSLESCPNDTLYKVQAMLDTTKVQAKLKASTEERDKIATALEEHTLLVKELQAENSSLHDRTRDIESQFNECNAQLQKLQEKHSTLTEYFEQKEHNLHRVAKTPIRKQKLDRWVQKLLGAEEAVRQAVESREAQVKEKADSLEQAETRHTEELKQLRSEMFEIEKSLMAQVHTCQKRAEEAIAEQRRLEQECKRLKLEREDMRKRTSMKALPPAVGPSSDRPPSLTVHPPLAPYFPRTSSPGTVDPKDKDEMISLLSHTDSLPASLLQTHIPNPGNPNHSLHIVADRSDNQSPHFQAPLRHSADREMLHQYPPPGRRMIPTVRGYPPFDYQRPMPLPRVFYDPLHHVPRTVRDTNTVAERRPVFNPLPGARSTPPLGMYHPPPSNFLLSGHGAGHSNRDMAKDKKGKDPEA